MPFHKVNYPLLEGSDMLCKCNKDFESSKGKIDKIYTGVVISTCTEFQMVVASPYNFCLLFLIKFCSFFENLTAFVSMVFDSWSKN